MSSTWLWLEVAELDLAGILEVALVEVTDVL
jgi:hypothetical protein